MIYIVNKTLQKSHTYINENLKHILEFGVYKGSTIRQLRNMFDASFDVFGFDSFEGLPEAWSGTHHKAGAMSTNGVIPNVKGVDFYAGWFSETIPDYLEIAQPIGLLHVDCDLYSSTVDILWGLDEFIVDGTVIVFDEWYYNHRDIPEYRHHEQRAFYEWVEDCGVKSFDMPDSVEDERQIIVINERK